MKSFMFFFGIILSLGLNIKSEKIVDLTYLLTDDIPTYPSVKPFNFTEIINKKTPIWMIMKSFLTSEHMGTHLDAPYHFNADGWKLHEIPVDRFVAPAVVINISHRIDQPEKLVVTPDDIVEWERFHGLIPKKSIVLMFSGWDRYWGDHKKYIYNNQEEEKDVKTPGFSPEAAEWLVKNRDIVGLGVDTLSIDPNLPEDFPTHRIGAAANKYNLENLKGLSRLPPVGATVYALPIKIKDGTGAPTRVIATIPDNLDYKIQPFM